MDIKETITSAWSDRDLYTGLSILEAMCVWSSECPGEALPEQMHDDMVKMFGLDAVQGERDLLLSTGVITLKNGGTVMDSKFYKPLSSLVNEKALCMQVFFNGIRFPIGEFMSGLGEYLVREAGATKQEQPCNDNCRLSLTWEDKAYEFRIAFSPVWLPAIADRAAENNMFVAALCPFAALQWEKTMISYYEYPSFRNHTACYDPWNNCKLNISKGGLFTYFDWYLRDAYGSKFSIPGTFSQALFDMGLLRYNDER
ncbi:MAG: hypothetical protein FWG53_02285 [Clostridiales bacterium]|nr:hypothetical protein [Clostridiales bacterium]